jgi:deoxyribonuclease (pyrimidine dimer)
MDQHLFAEFREIKMIPKSLARSIAARGVQGVLKRVPPAFTLNTGHVSFFYDKGAYLHERYWLLRMELLRRGFNINLAALLDPDHTFASLPDTFFSDYEPTPEALQIIRTRIAEKIAMRPGWYRYEGKVVNSNLIGATNER